MYIYDGSILFDYSIRKVFVKTLIYTKTTAKIADFLYYTALKYQNNQNVTATGIFLIIFSDLDGCIASK